MVSVASNTVGCSEVKLRLKRTEGVGTVTASKRRVFSRIVIIKKSYPKVRKQAKR